MENKYKVTFQFFKQTWNGIECVDDRIFEHIIFAESSPKVRRKLKRMYPGKPFGSLFAGNVGIEKLFQKKKK